MVASQGALLALVMVMVTLMPLAAAQTTCPTNNYVLIEDTCFKFMNYKQFGTNPTTLKTICTKQAIDGEMYNFDRSHDFNKQLADVFLLHGVITVWVDGRNEGIDVESQYLSNLEGRSLSEYYSEEEERLMIEEYQGLQADNRALQKTGTGTIDPNLTYFECLTYNIRHHTFELTNCLRWKPLICMVAPT